MKKKIDSKDAMVAVMVAQAPLNLAKATAIAEQFEVPVRSVIASATRRGIAYDKKPRLSKAGVPAVQKPALVESIADQLSVDAAVLEGLEKATKQALQNLLSAILNTVELLTDDTIDTVSEIPADTI